MLKLTLLNIEGNVNESQKIVNIIKNEKEKYRTNAFVL